MEAIPSFTSSCGCARRGAGLGWEELVRGFGERLWRKARKALEESNVAPRPERVEEVVQEVYCRLLAQRFHCCGRCGEQHLVALLGKVARGVVCDDLRARLAAKRGADVIVHVDGGLLEGAPDPGPTPEERLLQDERRRLFFTFCRKLLPNAHRQRDARILHLALVEGLSSPEISRRLGGRLAPSSVDSTISRLRQRLAGEGVDLPRRTPWRERRPAGRRRPKEGGRNRITPRVTQEWEAGDVSRPARPTCLRS